jgi:hypothetical protein
MNMNHTSILAAVARLIVIIAAIAAVPLTAQAQESQVAAPPAATSSFDPYRSVAVTAGVIGGTILAIIVTDGVMYPVYRLLGGGPAGMMHVGYGTVRGAVQLLGAISGAFYADSLYMNH